MGERPWRVRRGSLADAGALRDLTIELGYAPAEPGAYRELVSALLGSHADHLFVAERDGAVVGYLLAHCQRRLGLPGPMVTIEELVVLRSERGRGVGRGLVAAASALAAQLGAARVQLVTARSNESYRRGFYRQNGFAEVDSAVLRARDVAKPGATS